MWTEQWPQLFGSILRVVGSTESSWVLLDPKTVLDPLWGFFNNDFPHLTLIRTVCQSLSPSPPQTSPLSVLSELSLSSGTRPHTVYISFI